MLGHPGVGGGGVPLVPACCGTMGIAVVEGRWHTSGTACASGRNLSLCLQGGPNIWGSPLGIAHLHPRSLFLWQCCCQVLGGVVSPVGAAKGRRESLSPCLLVVWFALLGLLVWVGLVLGWAPCPQPVSGRAPSSLVFGRGGYVDAVFSGSFCAVDRSRHVPKCPRRAVLGVCFPELWGCVARPSGLCSCVVLSQVGGPARLLLFVCGGCPPVLPGGVLGIPSLRSLWVDVFAQAAGCPRYVCKASRPYGTWVGCLGCNVCVLPKGIMGWGRDLVQHLRRW